jgi:hypothetical protein
MVQRHTLKSTEWRLDSYASKESSREILGFALVRCPGGMWIEPFSPGNKCDYQTDRKLDGHAEICCGTKFPNYRSIHNAERQLIERASSDDRHN